jgi:hypothetical protein
MVKLNHRTTLMPQVIGTHAIRTEELTQKSAVFTGVVTIILIKLYSLTVYKKSDLFSV